jgi:hypothetical protein
VKSTLALAAGCLVAALAVGDTVYHIAPRAGLTYPPEPVTVASVGDISDLTDQEDEEMNADLDSLFALGRDGLDSSELASLRELASIAKPHSSHWGDEFYKEGAKGVANVSPFTMKHVSGCWDPTLDRVIRTQAGPYAHSGWGTGLVDEYSLSPVVSNDKFYGQGGHGGGHGRRRHHSPAHVASQYCPKPQAVPEPASLSLIALGAAALLRRRHRAE